MIREQVVCKGCGVEFESHHRGRDYCSTICKIMRRAAATMTLPVCWGCKAEYWPDAHEAGQSRADFAQEHQSCRRAFLDKAGRPDNCRCAECKRRKGITDVLSVPPSQRQRSAASRHSKHRKLVLERDAYVCQICGLPTDPAARPTDDRYPTLDHIESIALFGGGDDPGNLRTAHRWCNVMLGEDGYAREEEVRAVAQQKFGRI